MIYIAIVLVCVYLLWVASLSFRHDRQVVYYKPTEKDIARERRLMKLEERHFGHLTDFYFRQTHEYQEWLKTQRW